MHQEFDRQCDSFAGQFVECDPPVFQSSGKFVTVDVSRDSDRFGGALLSIVADNRKSDLAFGKVVKYNGHFAVARSHFDCLRTSGPGDSDTCRLGIVDLPRQTGPLVARNGFQFADG